jgi:Zn finger protein HypA/HybF involved in hydrogenase expression
MEGLDEMVVPVELKYCERCGGLWLRETEAAEIYCPGCRPEMVDLPRGKKKRVVVVAVNSIDELEGCLAELTAFCGEGGNA